MAQDGAANWYALWTRSNCEQLVHDQLCARGFHPFLPKAFVWSRRRGARVRLDVPMFPGYLFLRDLLDKRRYVEARSCRGLVAILGERWDRLAVVPCRDIESILRLTNAGAPVVSHPYMREGERVRVIAGPLAGVEGNLLRVDLGKGLLIVSLDLLQRSVATEVDCTLVAAA